MVVSVYQYLVNWAQKAHVDQCWDSQTMRDPLELVVMKATGGSKYLVTNDVIVIRVIRRR